MFEKLVKYGINLQTKTIKNVKSEIRKNVEKQFVNVIATLIHLILNWRSSQFVVKAKNIAVLSKTYLNLYLENTTVF